MNFIQVQTNSESSDTERFLELLENAVRQKTAGNQADAEKLLVKLLEKGAPPELQERALLELAVLAHEKKDLAKAQQIYAQFLKKYPQDPGVAEVLLRQGLIYREMGAPVLALSKFYAVMSTALHLKSDRLEYYQGLVLHAQSEIADTYYVQGKYDEALDFFGRLLKLNSPSLDRAMIHYKFVRCLSLRKRYDELIVQAPLYLDRYPQSQRSAEMHFLCAQAFRELGRDSEAIDQLFALLKSPHDESGPAGADWAYWQQRTGNELGNQLYREGDFLNAMEVYRALAEIDSAPDWQLPALYQLGLVYERLRQPAMAVETYDRILRHQSTLGSNSVNPTLKDLFSMAKWRKEFLAWQEHADAALLLARPDTITVSSHE